MNILRSMIIALLLGSQVIAFAAVETRTLSNGMQIIAVQVPNSQVSGVHLSLAIGPERVPAEKMGLRGLLQQVLLETMVKQVTSQPELASLKRDGSQGASFSVETQWDAVEFSASCVNENFKSLVKYLSEAVFKASWKQEDVITARELIDADEAGEFGMDDPGSQAMRLFLEALYGETAPVSYPFYGTHESLKNITVTDVSAFYQGNYIPNLATLCVVGPQSPRALINLASDEFEKLEKKEIQPAPELVIPPGEDKVEIAENIDTSSAAIISGVPLIVECDRDWVTAQIIIAALTGQKGRLTEARKDIPTPATPDEEMDLQGMGQTLIPIPFSRNGYLALIGRASPVQIEIARAWAQAVLDGFISKPLSEVELKRAVQRAVNFDAQTRDGAALLATATTRRYLMLGRHLDAANFAEIASELTAEDIQDYAKRCFTRHAFSVLMPVS